MIHRPFRRGFCLCVILLFCFFSLSQPAAATPAQAGVTPLCERGLNSGIFTHVYKFETPGGQYLELEYNSVLGWRILEDYIRQIGDTYFYFAKNKDCAEALVKLEDPDPYWRGSLSGTMFRTIGSGNGWFDRHDSNGILTRFAPLDPGNPTVSKPIRILKEGLQTFFFRDSAEVGSSGLLNSVEFNRPVHQNGHPYLPGQYFLNLTYDDNQNLKNVELLSGADKSILKTWSIEPDINNTGQISYIKSFAADSSIIDLQSFSYFNSSSTFRGLIKTVVFGTGGKTEVNYGNPGVTPPFYPLSNLRFDPYVSASNNQDYQPTLLRFTYTPLPPSTPDSKFNGFTNVTLNLQANPIWRKQVTMISDPAGVRSLPIQVVTKGKHPPTSQSETAFKIIEDFHYSYTSELGPYSPDQTSNPPQFVALTRIEGEDNGRQFSESGTFDFALGKYTQRTSTSAQEPTQITERVYQPSALYLNKPYFVNLIDEKIYKEAINPAKEVSHITMEYSNDGHLTKIGQNLNELEANEVRYEMLGRTNGLPGRIVYPDGSIILARYDRYNNFKNITYRTPNTAPQNSPKVTFTYDPTTHLLERETHPYFKFEYSYDKDFKIKDIIKNVGDETVSSKSVNRQLGGVTDIVSNNLVTFTKDTLQQKILSLDGFGNLNQTANKIAQNLYANKATQFDVIGNPIFTTLRPFIAPFANFRVKTLNADPTGGGITDRHIFDFEGTPTIAEIKSGGPIAQEFLNGLRFSPLQSGLKIFYAGLPNHDYYLTRDTTSTTLKSNYTQVSVGHFPQETFMKSFNWLPQHNGMRITDGSGYEIRKTEFDKAGRIRNFKSVGLPELRYSYANQQGNDQAIWKEFGDQYTGSRVEDIFVHGKLTKRNYGPASDPQRHTLINYYDDNTKTRLTGKALTHPEIHGGTPPWSAWGHLFTVNSHDHNNRMTSSTEFNPTINDPVNCEYAWTDDGKLTEFNVKLLEGVKIGFKINYDKHTGEMSEILIPNLSQTTPAVTYDNLGTNLISRVAHPLTNETFDLNYYAGELREITGSSPAPEGEKVQFLYDNLFGGLGEWRYFTNSTLGHQFSQKVVRRGPGGAPLTIETDSLGNNNPLTPHVVNITYNQDGRLESYQRNNNPMVTINYDPANKYLPLSSYAAGTTFPITYNSLQQKVSYSSPYEEKIEAQFSPSGHQRQVTISEATGKTRLNIIPSVHEGNQPFGAIYQRLSNQDVPISAEVGEFNYCGGLFRTIGYVDYTFQGNTPIARVPHRWGYLYVPGLRVSRDSLQFYNGWTAELEFDLDQDLSQYNNSYPTYYPAPLSSDVFTVYKDFTDIVDVVSRNIDQSIPNNLGYPDPHDPDLSYKTASGRDMIQKNPAEMNLDELYRVSEKALRVDDYIQELLPGLNTKFVAGVKPGHLATGMLERFYEPRNVLSSLERINEESSPRVNSRLNTFDKFNYSQPITTFSGEGMIDSYLEKYTESRLPKNSENQFIFGILGSKQLEDLMRRPLNPYDNTLRSLRE